MKKLLLLFTIFPSFLVFSQKIPQGTRFIGGDINIGFQRLKVEKIATSNILSLSFSPSFTKFKKDNFSVTTLIGYNIERHSDIPFITNFRFPNYTTQHSFSVGQYHKNYKMLTEKLGISAQYGGNIGLSFGSYRVKTAGVPRSEQRQSINQSIALTISAGSSVIYLLNEKIAIEGSATLLNFNILYAKNESISTFSVSTGLSGSPFLGIGIRYFYKKKRAI
jgi:hypothetical protein